MTGGQAHDLPSALALLAEVKGSARLFLADANYDAEPLRSRLAEQGTTSVIPNRRYRRHPFPFDPAAYAARNAIERMFCRLKDFRRIATRYDKLARNYHAGLCLAAELTCRLR